MGFFGKLESRKKELGIKLEKHRAEKDLKEFQATKKRILILKQKAIKEESRVLRQQRQKKALTQEAKLKKQIRDAKAVQNEARAEKIKAIKEGFGKILDIGKQKPHRRRKTAKRKTTRRKPLKRRRATKRRTVTHRRKRRR